MKQVFIYPSFLHISIMQFQSFNIFENMSFSRDYILLKDVMWKKQVYTTVFTTKSIGEYQ